MIEIVIDEGVHGDFPPLEHITQAIDKTCHALKLNLKQPQICIRFAHNQNVQALNAQWRNQDKVTDVLSFPMQENHYHDGEPLGDIVLAVPFIEQEALRLGLDVQAHALHLIIHSTLHLLGHDHIEQQDAAIMQTLECDIMQKLHLHHPYPDGICDHA